MNIYRTKFFAICPNNDVRIEYVLEIKTDRTLMVEDIISAVQLLDRGYHEDIADQLHREFGGLQRLTASHHGVEIETHRPQVLPWIKPSETVSNDPAA